MGARDGVTRDELAMTGLGSLGDPSHACVLLCCTAAGKQGICMQNKFDVDSWTRPYIDTRQICWPKPRPVVETRRLFAAIGSLFLFCLVGHYPDAGVSKMTWLALG